MLPWVRIPLSPDYTYNMYRIINNLKGKSRSELASYAYIPLIGWLIPLFIKKDDRFCQHHARQGFILAVIFVLTAVTLNFTNIMIFTLQEWEDFRIVLIISIYIIYILYLIICIVNFLLTAKGREFDFPLIKYLAKYIEL